MKIPFEWERISNEDNIWSTYRAKVFGGWIVRSWDVDDCNTQAVCESSVFIPDPRHEWKV